MNREVVKNIKLGNNQYMKILFSYFGWSNIWFVDIVVANSKRKCNDCIGKSEGSPKKLYGKCTGNGLGIKPFIIALKELLNFEKTLTARCQIRIVGANDRLANIYSRLTRYGYTSLPGKCENGSMRDAFVKNIK